MTTPRPFAHFIVVDWSGEAVARPQGLAVAQANRGAAAPILVNRAERWSRQSILDELLALADAESDVVIGLDLSPGLPFVDQGTYFPAWERSPPDAKTLWRLVDEWSTDDPHLATSGFLAHPEVARHFRHQRGAGDLFIGGRGRLRVCEEA